MAFTSSEPGSVSRPGSGIVSPQQRARSRAQSINSDRPSTIGHSLMSPPMSVSPEAAFIAASAASQIVTNDHDNHANTWYDQHGIEPSGETALVSHAALQLVNNFLDQLLFSFLALARSTSLSALRPAVTEVLKPKLAKDAINQADEELREYLGGGDDEDMLQSQTSSTPKDWDLELVWKRTRLRCMVYSSLGDMEEEDEDFYMEQEHLDEGDEALGETVSPAVAIFLTSILEFMGEQSLISAGQAAYHRMRFIYEKERKNAAISNAAAAAADRITVEEVDMERVAFDRTIGRLWRAWKKRIRSPVTDIHAFQQRSFSYDLGRQSAHVRQSSQEDAAVAEEPASAQPIEEQDEPASAAHPTSDGQQESDKALLQQPAAAPAKLSEEEWLSTATSVALPVDERDIAEILLPGLAYYSDDEEGLDGDDETNSGFGRRKQRKAGKNDDARRPKSLMILPHTIVTGLPTPTSSEPRTPALPHSRKRANSLPTPSTSPYALPFAKRVKASEEAVDDSDEEKEGEEEDDDNDINEDDSTSFEIVQNHGASVTENAHGSIGDKILASVAGKQKKRPTAVLQTSIIGAAITTTSPRAIRLSSMTGDQYSNGEEEAEEDEIDEFTEEPEILTSSRVSISGRSNSPAVSEQGRPVSMSPGLPARSPSVRSLRVIDVTGPRSPVSRSRTSSVDAHDPAVVPRGNNISRTSTSSISAQPIAEESGQQPGHSDTGPAVSGVRSSSSFTGTKMSRTYTSESISEVEEIISPVPRRETGHRAEAAQGPVSETPRSAKRFEDMQSFVQASQPIFGSANRHAAPLPSPTQSPLHPPPPPVSKVSGSATKVTILSSSTSSGSFFIDDKPEVPAKTQPTAVAVPERSTRRRGSSGAPGASATPATPAASVGAAATAQGSISQREQPPSPSCLADRSAPRSSREQQTRADVQTQAQVQARPEASRQQSHASASSMSSATSKLKPIRTSEDSAVMRPEDVARNFEQLIQSDQTIQYTLTPENMRDIDSTRSITDGSSVLPKGRRSEDARQPSERSRSSSVNNRTDVRQSPSASRTNTFDSRSTELPVTSKLQGPVPRSPRSNAPSVASNSSRPRVAAQAREARVAKESLADFAEFIRATGPPGEPEASVPAPASRNGTIGAGSVSNALRNVGMGPAGYSKTSIDSGRVSTFSSRQRYQAREPVVDYKDDNSDLIDFIRRGPPNTGGNPRIPRTVAPFRTTMDSDQMTNAVGGRALDANIPNLRYSAASTNVTDSSMGSSAGLLKKDNKPSPRLGTGAASNGNMFDPPEMAPKRRTRRVKDPYAIDFSDEEDDDFDAAPRRGGQRGGPPAKEESLLDFLSSVPPPSETSPVLFDIPQTRSKQQAPRKKASAPSLMSRFSRSGGGSGNTSPRGLNSSNGNAAPPVSFNNGGGLDGRSLSSRAGSTMSGRGRGYIPIQVNMPPGYDKYGPTSASSGGGASSAGGSNRPVAAPAGSGRRVPMKRFEPREAQPVPSRATQDLADFFRNSGPPQSFRG
ncbi:hypothetical protein SPI_04070 [Niveomyces insectorum RCEF 264]|uniref:Flo11 n=1 Tax=Niveomyces insectorum RCEF 264 TaxID=1081102 RepID=A0A167VEN0_9HYPO|nr:hypothetical protein SPI_04070 [Niveomyces insectorum RCEF 264]